MRVEAVVKTPGAGLGVAHPGDCSDEKAAAFSRGLGVYECALAAWPMAVLDRLAELCRRRNR